MVTPSQSHVAPLSTLVTQHVFVTLRPARNQSHTVSVAWRRTSCISRLAALHRHDMGASPQRALSHDECKCRHLFEDAHECTHHSQSRTQMHSRATGNSATCSRRLLYSTRHASMVKRSSISAGQLARRRVCAFYRPLHCILQLLNPTGFCWRRLGVASPNHRNL